MVHTCPFAVLRSSLVRRLLNVFVDIGPTDQFLGPVPHGQPCGWVVEENAIVTRPYDTPDAEVWRHVVMRRKNAAPLVVM